MRAQWWRIPSSFLCWVLAFSFVLGIGSGAWANLRANKRCYTTNKCGGWLDSVCEGEGSFCSYCSGATGTGPFCFNKPGAWCDALPNPVPCGKVVIGACGANGYCSNTSLTQLTCYAERCNGGVPPPPPPI